MSPTEARISIQLNQTDFDRLVAILETLAEWRTETGRIDVLDEMFAGSPRKRDVLRVRSDGTAHQAAVRVIQHLAQFGQDTPGRETLFVLSERLCNYIGNGAEADFLRGLPQQYPATSRPADGVSATPGAAPATMVVYGTVPAVQLVYEVLVKRFSLDEMRDLCFQLNVDHEEITGETKPAFARGLVTYMDRRTHLPELGDAIRKARGAVV
jgi:Effector-associated domain 7/Effector-associated domain 8